LQEAERKRLFSIIEDLVKWENSTNEEVLERARSEIRRSCGGVLPQVYDPFSGGGSIPLEAQRLGLPAYGSDLNPVAVMIGKAMIEFPPKFKDREPVHPGIKERNHYRNAEGLAEDVKYYGEWIRDKAWERIRALKRELPPAIAELQAANIAPADMPQSAIGPGMGVFSRYKAVLESDDRPMTVKAALQLINHELHAASREPSSWDRLRHTRNRTKVSTTSRSILALCSRENVLQFLVMPYVA
jgi:adenine-specific DNA methylase